MQPLAELKEKTTQKHHLYSFNYIFIQFRNVIKKRKNTYQKEKRLVMIKIVNK